MSLSAPSPLKALLPSGSCCTVPLSDRTCTRTSCRSSAPLSIPGTTFSPFSPLSPELFPSPSLRSALTLSLILYRSSAAEPVFPAVRPPLPSSSVPLSFPATSRKSLRSFLSFRLSFLIALTLLLSMLSINSYIGILMKKQTISQYTLYSKLFILSRLF